MYGLRWLVKQNIPVLTTKERSTWQLRRDAWLAGFHEKTTIREVLSRKFDFKIDVSKRFFTLHRVPAWKGTEFVVEIFGEGARLGLLYYDSRGEWDIIPSGALASILVNMGIPSYELKMNNRRYVKNKKLKLEQSACLDKRDYIILKMGKYSGVGRVIDRENCYVKIKDIAISGFRLLIEPSQLDLIEYNKEIVEKAAREARSFIKYIYDKFVSPGLIHVSFSGGADSTAVLTLAVEELGRERVVAVTSDTGLDFPENTKYINEITKKLGVKLVALKPSHDFISEIAKQGLMSVNNRWCTELMKLKPLREYYVARNIKIYLDGARDYESLQRARSPRFSENPALPGVYRALPIKKWPRVLVQLYLLSRGISMNPLYDQGFTRIGCIVCPAMHRHELILSYSKYQEIHEEIMKSAGVTLDEYLSMEWTGRRIFKRGKPV